MDDRVIKKRIKSDAPAVAVAVSTAAGETQEVFVERRGSLKCRVTPPAAGLSRESRMNARVCRSEVICPVCFEADES